MPVNGAYYSWEDLNVMGPIGPIADIQSIEYGDEREIEHVYGQGAAPRGVGRGNWKGEGKLSMTIEAYNLLVTFASAAGKSIYTMSPFTISCVYANSDQGLTTDQLLRCRFKKKQKKAAQNDKSIMVDLDFIFEDLEENGASSLAGLNLI